MPHRSEAVLSGVGQGESFEEVGMQPQILHAPPRRMTIEEIKLLSSSGDSQIGNEMQKPI